MCLTEGTQRGKVWGCGTLWHTYIIANFQCVSLKYRVQTRNILGETGKKNKKHKSQPLKHFLSHSKGIWDNSKSCVEAIRSFKHSKIFLSYVSKHVCGSLYNGLKGARMKNDAS